MSKPENPSGEWKDVLVLTYLKGFRRNPKYYPAIGETCRMSGPNCDNANGYTWSEVEVLWADDLFVVTRTPGCWPTVTKHQLALFEPKPADLLACPFCGGEASDTGHIQYSRPLDTTTWLDGQPVTEAFYVNCMSCGAVSRSGVVGGYQTKAEAITAWNTRADLNGGAA